jgi:cytochrome c oxidase assembly protein Cox11
MPVFFYIDPKFITDKKMNGVTEVTLSYQFLNVDKVHSRQNKIEQEEIIVAKQ